MSAKTNLEKRGTAQAALLAAMLGPLALSLVNLGTEVSEAFKTTIHKIGKLWMPGAEGIGPYSGKETVSVVVWLGSWYVFHQILRSREVSNPTVLAIFLAGIALATTLLWPPVTHWVVHYFGG